MPTTVETFRPSNLAQSDSADHFALVLDVVCKEFAPGIAPLNTEQVRAAAQLADEAWRQFCEVGGDAGSTVRWVRQRLARDRAMHTAGLPSDCPTAERAFRALFDLHGMDLPES